MSMADSWRRMNEQRIAYEKQLARSSESVDVPPVARDIPHKLGALPLQEPELSEVRERFALIESLHIPSTSIEQTEK